MIVGTYRYYETILFEVRLNGGGGGGDDAVGSGDRHIDKTFNFLLLQRKIIYRYFKVF
ncbi:hypothetical protein V6W75_09310 [Mannheimia sp. HC-2023]